jgi:hypothetical protein
VVVDVGIDITVVVDGLVAFHDCYLHRNKYTENPLYYVGIYLE